MSTDKNKRIAIRPNSLKQKAIDKRKEVGAKGWATGYTTLDEIISYKRGYSTTVFSYAHQGKTQFTLDQCVNLALMYGLKIAVYLTEAGDPEEIVLELAQTYMRRSLADPTLTDAELDFAIDWVDKFFYILQAPSGLFSITDLAYAVKETNEHFDIKIDVLVIDHFSNLDKDDKQKFFRIDEDVRYVMHKVNAMSKKLNLHTFILFHLRDTEPVKCPMTGKYYLPPPEPYNIAGGQQSFRLGYQLIGVWRPVAHPSKLGIVDPETGNPYELNETRVIVCKSKPKFTGQLGTRALFFHADVQSYKERINYDEYFALEKYSGDSELFGKAPKYPTFAYSYKQKEIEEKKNFLEEELNTSKDGQPTKVSLKDLGF